MTPLVLGPEDVARLLDPAALLDALADAFAAAARGEVLAPPRSALQLDAARGLLVMPGHRAGGPVIVKHVGLYDGNPARGLPHHPATICAFDAGTGALLAVLDATELTAVRTAGAAALSIRLAARPDARVVAVIGAGPVAAAHLRVLPAVLPGAELRVAARDPARAAALAAAARRDRGRGGGGGGGRRRRLPLHQRERARRRARTRSRRARTSPRSGSRRPAASCTRSSRAAAGCSSRRATRSRRRRRAAPSWPGWTRTPPRSWGRCCSARARPARAPTSSRCSSRWGR